MDIEKLDQAIELKPMSKHINSIKQDKNIWAQMKTNL
jgi:hypothetical protein